MGRHRRVQPAGQQRVPVSLTWNDQQIQRTGSTTDSAKHRRGYTSTQKDASGR